MSLINNALKRAQSVPHRPITDGPSLRAAEPIGQKNRVPRLILVAAVMVFAGLTIFWVIRANQRNPETVSLQVRARTSKPGPASEPPQKAEQFQTLAAPGTSVAAVPAAALQKEADAATTAARVHEVAASETNPSPPAIETAGTEAAPAPVAAPKPLKLQSIVYSRQPSAMISGTLIYQGESFRSYKVGRITQRTVELLNGSETIYLTLE